MSDAPPPNWRDNEASPSEPAGTKPWQPRDASASDSPSPSRRGLKRGIALVALLAIAIGIGVVVWMWRPIKPACLVLIGSGYETNFLLPHNVFGWNGLGLMDKDLAQEDKAITGFFERSTKMRRIGDRVEVKDQTWKEVWKDVAEKIDAGSLKEETVVLFISMHGIADKDEAYLLPNKQSTKGFNQSRIPFADVLDSLKNVKKKKVVLLLDVTQAQAEWSIGVLHNDFIKRLQETYETKIKEAGNLTVICSSSADQRSWASEELQNSIFAHYVTEGLKGAAGQTVNEPVTAWTLFKYVEENVDKWAQTNRARKQTPLLLGEQKLAENTKLILVPEAYKKSDEPQARKLDLDGLKTEWTKWKALKEQDSYVYAPHVWRIYQETLLRYEQIQRAGDPTGAAEDLKKRLNKLHANITVGRSLDKAYASLGNSFPVYQALGYRVTKDDLRDPALLAFLTRLRKADSLDEKNAILAQFREKSPTDKQYLQARLAELVLKEADRPGKFDRAAEEKRLDEIEKELHAPQRSAEVELLKMLQAADKDLDGDQIRQALRVRTSAERAALSATQTDDREQYAEAIFPWTQERVETADVLRRAGEDLLFGDPKVDGVEAGKKLKEAEKQYKAVRDEARDLQKAMALRDEISADLPFLAAWLAAAPPDAKLKTKVQDLEELGGRLAELNRNLDVDKKVTRADDLDKIAADARALRDDFQGTCVALRKGIVLQQNWHALDALLSSPPMDSRDDDVALRLALLGRIRFISEELFNNKGLVGNADKDDTTQTDRQRRLLRACLKSFDIPDKEKESVDHKVREFFLKLPQDILAKSEGATDDSRLDDVVADLVAAANLCRTVPGAMAEQIRGETGDLLNPVDRLRRVRTIRLLDGLARRTLEDHWFGPGPDPYYLSAGRAYLEGARGLFDKVQMSKKLLKEVDDLQAKFVLADLKILKRPDPYWTTEYDFPLAWKVQADEGLVQKGTPIVWLEVKKGAKTDKVWLPSPRKLVSVWPGKKPFDDAFRLNRSNLFDEGDVTVTFHAVYRGQHLSDPLTLLRAPPKVIVRHFPAPEKAALAVRMDSAFDYGAISIVLDNSGSMRWAYPVTKKEDVERLADRTNKKDKRRFDYALEALKHVLQTIPDNTELSIFTLGQTVDKKPNYRPSLLKPPAPWRKNKLDDLLADLDDLPGDYASPIAEGIVESMNKGFSPDFKGPRVILVLTDGDDNFSGRDETPKDEKERKDHTEKVVEMLKAANTKDKYATSVVVVCFIQPEGFDKKGERVPNAEYERAKAQFEGVASFKPLGIGQFTLVPDGKQLGTAIEALVRPRVVLKVGDDIPVGFKEGATINYHKDQAIQWREVNPNFYRANIMKTQSEVAVDLLRGQNLFAVLKNKNGKAYLERGIIGKQAEAARRGIETRHVLMDTKDQGGWLVSLLENHNHLSNKLTELVAFESLDVEGSIRQVHPGFAWLELDSLDGKKPDQTLTLTRDWRVPAFAYQLEMPVWPLRCSPKLTAWFAPEERSKFLVNDNLVAHLTVPIPFEGSKSTAPVLDAKARIESAMWETYEVDNPAGGKTKENCLVVRVHHAKGKPVWIGLKKAGAEVGSEHHFFPDASGGTAYFYKLKKIEEAEIFLVDIEAFKAASTRVVFTPEGTIRPPEMFLNRLE